ncbi:hypothetical protein E1301_Tti015581 [Triplophysa tibetana]|uniref:Uncharacterized protein n=1 Tax=Triplophysa tibetana TaxID=1572043 RepID=A0A5A9NVK8_9TELE|nr:hypothetical protein E1301_Tti015581 [Triplophysa tibetana]
MQFWQLRHAFGNEALVGKKSQAPLASFYHSTKASLSMLGCMESACVTKEKFISYRLTSGMQANNRIDDVEGDPDRVDPFYHQGK